MTCSACGGSYPSKQKRRYMLNKKRKDVTKTTNVVKKTTTSVVKPVAAVVEPKPAVVKKPTTVIKLFSLASFATSAKSVIVIVGFAGVSI